MATGGRPFRRLAGVEALSGSNSQGGCRNLGFTGREAFLDAMLAFRLRKSSPFMPYKAATRSKTRLLSANSVEVAEAIKEPYT
jgi:hypothetical protein